MNHRIEPHPLNADGPFYVEYSCCTACDVPMQEAPSLFQYDSDSHCYVCRQPTTDEEMTKMVGAAWMAEFECIRYRGDDPTVLRRLAELDLRKICDIQPPVGIKPVIRNHVEFVVSGEPSVTSSRQLATEFRDHLISLNNESRHFTFKPIRSSGQMTSFEFSWYEDHFHPIRFHPAVEIAIRWHIEYPLQNKLADRGVGSIVSHWLMSSDARFRDIRWYSDSDWNGSKEWQSTLW